MALDGWSAIATVYDPLKAGSIDGTDEDPHDCGVVRALNSTYRPNRGVVGDPACTVFVARLHPDTTEDTISDHLARYGRLKRVKLIRDIITGFSKCYAFAEFESARDASRAQREGYKSFIDDQEVFIDYEVERTMKGWVPRRLGGGLGGKKEAGQLRFGGKDRPFRKPILLDKREMEFGDGSSRRPDGDRHRGRDRSYQRRSRSPELDRAPRRGRSRSPERERSSYSSNRGERSPSRSQRQNSRKRSRSRSKERYGRPRSDRPGPGYAVGGNAQTEYEVAGAYEEEYPPAGNSESFKLVH